MNELHTGKAYYTHDYDDAAGHLWYFGMHERAVGKLTQRTVTAIIDIDSDGCLAGVELIDGMPPHFPSKASKPIQ
jgi:hypothetical protein